MSTSVKFLSSTMPNAPQLSATDGSMIAVLDACLVNGWNTTTADSVSVAAGVVTANFSAGHPFVKWQVVQVAGATPAGLNGEARVTEVTTNTVKWQVTGVADGTATGTITLKTAPLGWQKPYSGTNKGVYKINNTLFPDAPACLVRFDENYTYGAKVAGYESMTSVDAGTSEFPSSGQAPSGLWVIKTESASPSENRSWFIIGDGRLFYFGINNYTSDLNYTGATWSAFGQYSNNSIDAYAFVVTGTANSENTGVYSASDNVFYSNQRDNYQFIARSYDGLTSSRSFEIRSWPTQYGVSGGNGPIAFPNGPNSGMYLCPADIIENSAAGWQHRGSLPGAYMLPHNMIGRVVSDRRSPVLDDSIAGFSGRVIGFFPTAYSPGNRSWGIVALDLTGPWER
jgi:hypothetical protein